MLEGLLQEELFLPVGVDFLKIYEQCARPVVVKGLKRGEPCITYPDKEKRKCEIAFTYLIKDYRAVFTLQLYKEDSVYKGQISDIRVEWVEVKNNRLETRWAGKIHEAWTGEKLEKKIKEKVKDATECFLQDIEEIRTALQER